MQRQSAGKLIWNIFQSNATASTEIGSRFTDTLKKLGIVLEPVIEPIILRLKADQNAGRFPVAGNDDLALLGETQVA